MRAILILTATMLAICASAAQAQGAYPPAVTARVKAMLAQCQAAGGQPRNTDRILFRSADLNGDGRPEHIVDESAFVCSANPAMFQTPDGAVLEVFSTGPDGAARSVFRQPVTAHSYAATRPLPTLLVKLSDKACGGPTPGGCVRAVVWDRTTGSFVARSSSELASGRGTAQTPPRAAATAAPPAATGSSLSPAEQSAVFKAAGFQADGRFVEECEGGVPRGQGRIEPAGDLNRDGRPEVWITMTEPVCHGPQKIYILASKTAQGSWSVLLNWITSPRIEQTRTLGWPDIVMGDSPYLPVNKFDGREYRFTGYLRPRTR